VHHSIFTSFGFVQMTLIVAWGAQSIGM